MNNSESVEIVTDEYRPGHPLNRRARRTGPAPKTPYDIEKHPPSISDAEMLRTQQSGPIIDESSDEDSVVNSQFIKNIIL